MKINPLTHTPSCMYWVDRLECVCVCVCFWMGELGHWLAYKACSWVSPQCWVSSHLFRYSAVPTTFNLFLKFHMSNCSNLLHVHMTWFHILQFWAAETSCGCCLVSFSSSSHHSSLYALPSISSTTELAKWISLFGYHLTYWGPLSSSGPRESFIQAKWPLLK